MILVMTAPGVCFWREINGQQTSREICPPSNTLFPMNIDRWNSALHFQLRGQKFVQIIIQMLFRYFLNTKYYFEAFQYLGTIGDYYPLCRLCYSSAYLQLCLLWNWKDLNYECKYMVVNIDNHKAIQQVITSGLAIVAFLVFGGFETWYATGFDHMPLFIRQIGGGTFSGCAGIPGCETGFVVKGWAAAAVSYNNFLIL